MTGYADGGDAPHKELTPLPDAVAKADEFLVKHGDTRERFDRVADLVEGFESPFGLELLATVHWVVQEGEVTSQDELVERTYAWNDRKKQFTPRQIGLALDVLVEKGWLNPIETTSAG